MKTPIIVFSDKILNSLSWFMRIGGITLWPWIILREKYRDDPRYRDHLTKTINHESIHIKQQQELLVIFFYIWYILEFLVKLVKYWRVNLAYQNLSFEREAYINADNPDYLKTRKFWSFFKYIFKK